MRHQIGPVLLVLAAPDQLRVQVAVAALVCDADRALLLLLHHGLEFSAVGMFLREASSCVSVSTVFFFSFGHDFGHADSLRRLRAHHHRFDHLVELGFNLGLEIGLDLIDLGELGERPAAILPFVHAGHPVGIHVDSSPWRLRAGSP
jgi:hypothetical protein